MHHHWPMGSPLLIRGACICCRLTTLSIVVVSRLVRKLGRLVRGWTSRCVLTHCRLVAPWMGKVPILTRSRLTILRTAIHSRLTRLGTAISPRLRAAVCGRLPVLRIAVLGRLVATGVARRHVLTHPRSRLTILGTDIHFRLTIPGVAESPRLISLEPIDGFRLVETTLLILRAAVSGRLTTASIAVLGRLIG